MIFNNLYEKTTRRLYVYRTGVGARKSGGFAGAGADVQVNILCRNATILLYTISKEL